MGSCRLAVLGSSHQAMLVHRLGSAAALVLRLTLSQASGCGNWVETTH